MEPAQRNLSGRFAYTMLLSLLVGTVLRRWYPFHYDNALLDLVRIERPGIFMALRWTYTAMLYTTPLILLSTCTSLAFIFDWSGRGARTAKLPPYPDSRTRQDLFLVVGEIHKRTEIGPAQAPQWLTIPDRGLCTGVAVFGAIGSGKTSCCMYPFAEQILAYRAADPDRRIGALVLEVKGSFCFKVKGILEKHGRAEDYYEVNLGSACRYNPWYNQLHPFVLAYALGSLLNSLFGKSKEAFWQQSYTELVMWIITLHRAVYDYVTLFDVYVCIVDAKILASRMAEGMTMFHPAVKQIMVETECVLLEPNEYLLAGNALDPFPFDFDDATVRFRAPLTVALTDVLRALSIPFETELHSIPRLHSPDERKKAQFDGAERWYRGSWLAKDQKLRASIAAGIQVFLSLFDCDLDLRESFCPPKECYDPVKNADGRYGIPVPPLDQLIERGAVIAFNFPMSGNPGLARAIGGFLKQDFQRAMLTRIPEMSLHADKHWRHMMFLCDEYHAFATVGESDPTGDEKFFALSREARCIPLVATQSISSLRSTLGPAWETLVACFRTQIFLTLNDETSQRAASALCGKGMTLRESYTLSETGQEAAVSMITGTSTAAKASIGTSKAYSEQLQPTFETKAFAELGNAQAIVLAFDGRQPIPATYVYLKPYYLDPNQSYFEQLEAGLL